MSEIDVRSTRQLAEDLIQVLRQAAEADAPPLPSDVDRADFNEFIATLCERMVKGEQEYGAFDWMTKDLAGEIGDEWLDIAAYALFGWLRSRANWEK